MAETSLLTLDVGCGIYPKGDVNTDLIRREQKIPNFVVADAHNLPFKDGSFGLVYSSHVIEHVTNPTIMFNELCRVTKAKMIVRCPHRFGSGAKRVSHINFIDEAWFRYVADKMGLLHAERISVYDFPVTNRIENRLTAQYMSKFTQGFVWRVIRHAEFIFSRIINLGFEVECEVIK